MIRKAFLVLWLISTVAFAGTSWRVPDSMCVAAGDPDAGCTGAGTGTTGDKWALVTVLTEVKWMQYCNALVLAPARRNPPPVCTGSRIEDVEADATLNSCPSEATGERFPRRRVDVRLMRAGDGTFGGATGVSPDIDFDRYPGNKYNDREDIDQTRAKWRSAGVWHAPWNGQCRTEIRTSSNDRTNGLAAKGETIIDRQTVPIPETVAE